MVEENNKEYGLRTDLEIRLAWPENPDGYILYPEAEKTIEPPENGKLEEWLKYEINIH